MGEAVDGLDEFLAVVDEVGVVGEGEADVDVCGVGLE